MPAEKLTTGLIMKNLSQLVIIGVITAAIGSAFAQTNPPTASAAATAPSNVDGDFAVKHPRIAELLGRLRNERERISADLKEAKITEDQAEVLLEKARKIHREEMRDVRKNDGSLTKEEQEKLNKEEDKLSMRIHHEVAKNAEKKQDKAEKAEHSKSSKK
jgi:ribosomal protein L16 Arg81 hydroxylase